MQLIPAALWIHGYVRSTSLSIKGLINNCWVCEESVEGENVLWVHSLNELTGGHELRTTAQMTHDSIILCITTEQMLRHLPSQTSHHTQQREHMLAHIEGARIARRTPSKATCHEMILSSFIDYLNYATGIGICASIACLCMLIFRL